MCVCMFLYFQHPFLNFFFIFYIVVDFVIHWNETAMGLHVFPIPWLSLHFLWFGDSFYLCNSIYIYWYFQYVFGNNKRYPNCHIFTFKWKLIFLEFIDSLWDISSKKYASFYLQLWNDSYLQGNCSISSIALAYQNIYPLVNVATRKT